MRAVASIRRPRKMMGKQILDMYVAVEKKQEAKSLLLPDKEKKIERRNLYGKLYR